MSEGGASAVGFVFDLANALRRLDKETMIFATHYGRQALKQLPELLLRGRLPVEAPKVRGPIRDGIKLPEQHFPDPAAGRPTPRRVDLPVI